MSLTSSEPKKTIMLHVTSRRGRRSPTTTPASRVRFVVPDILLEADPVNERIKLTCMSFSMPNEIDQVYAPGCNTFTVRNVATGHTVDYVIPSGTYTFFEIASIINAISQPAVPAGHAGSVRARYDPISNKMVFSTKDNAVQPHTVRFDRGLAKLLGFDDSVPYPIAVGGPAVSPRYCRPLDTSHLMLKWTNCLSTVDGSLCLTNMDDSTATTTMTVDDTLAIVPVCDTPPWHTVSWSNPHHDVDGIWTADNKLNVLEFMVTDEEGEEFVRCPEWWATFKVQVHAIERDDEQEDLLRRIEKTLRDTLIVQLNQRRM